MSQLLTQDIHQLTKDVGGNDHSSRALVKHCAESKCFLIVCICINKEGHQPAGISNNQSSSGVRFLHRDIYQCVWKDQSVLLRLPASQFQPVVVKHGQH